MLPPCVAGPPYSFRGPFSPFGGLQTSQSHPNAYHPTHRVGSGTVASYRGGTGMEPFIGMCALFGFNWEPVGWALCNGQLLSISQNTALFSLLGTTYGGNG